MTGCDFSYFTFYYFNEIVGLIAEFREYQWIMIFNH